jgi:hypothetical protein
MYYTHHRIGMCYKLKFVDEYLPDYWIWFYAIGMVANHGKNCFRCVHNAFICFSSLRTCKKIMILIVNVLFFPLNSVRVVLPFAERPLFAHNEYSDEFLLRIHVQRSMGE